MTKSIYIDNLDSDGGFIIPEEISVEVIKELLKDPNYVLRKEGLLIPENLRKEAICGTGQGNNS